MVIVITVGVLVGLAVVITHIKRRTDAYDAARFDHLLAHPEADPAFWVAHDEIMDACYGYVAHA